MTSFKKFEKLEEVLQLFLLPNYNIVSTTYLDLLLTQIADDKTELRQNHRQLFLSWIPKALTIWNLDQKPCQAVISFTIKLVGLIAQDEESFKIWYCDDVYNKLCNVFRLRENDLSASIKMAYTSMLCNLIQHSSGRQWVNESGVWRDMISFAHLNHTLYVTRESQKFVWTLLLYESKNTNFCKDIIIAAVSPLTQNICNAQTHVILEENYMNDNALLCTTLDLLTSILENTLFHSLDNTIPSLIEELANLETRLRALFEACISTRFLQHILKLLLLSLFKRLKDGIKAPLEKVDDEANEKFRFGLCYMSTLLLSKKYVLDIVRMNKYSFIYWKKLKSLCEFSLGLPHKFEHQVICLMVMPLTSTYGAKRTMHDFFEIYINKMFEITCTAIQRICYNVRDVILKTDLPLELICKSSIEMLMEIINIMDRDVAIIIFQTMCYVLKNYAPAIENSSDCCVKTQAERQKKSSIKILLDGEPITERPILLGALLDGLITMTEKFKLKWQECVETICILSLAQHILDHSGVSPTICVKALKLCKLAIQNFMPPHLALLVDSDSHMNYIGPTLFKRLHNPNWEVVDSVFEVLNTMATISEDKYPAFQDFLLNHQFLQVAASVSMSDSESYVRASALIFLATTVRIEKLWTTTLSELELPEKAIHLINQESEAIVRREAVSLLTELYIHRQWQKASIDVMTNAMATAAVLDLHWEVKVNALQFWRHFIKSHLTDQGMLDGSFPNVTFSKEHRKIVQLNETEIKRRVNKALDDLAKQKCLGVILQCLKDDSDFEVCKETAKIISRLKTFLVKYKINEPFPVVQLPKDSATLDTTYVRPANFENCNSGETKTNSSNVIDDIVSKNDTNLLSAIYENSMKMDDEQNNEDENETLKTIANVTRQDFLNVILEKDINAYIEEKSSWLTTYTNSFESVLDDILTLYEHNDVNSMDCY
ncbi:uncharacterized protein LOC127289847 [Leptopilina boulardi]|uniref:uncharacterized protein LOC127289847 n=1 Tax=Leptopilina boulardi TaxID=63433 RepID=UPI0021F58145|nr:uncharacterized protein LOC127289847 [Leptopilina boulardi]XP_051174020.1 uncharacterized protein LOC127289847 [Leptopilina boulardi]XP_051174021.1 uncharacterized protein LOC127289847 [Leptopilina boulardi]